MAVALDGRRWRKPDEGGAAHAKPSMKHKGRHPGAPHQIIAAANLPPHMPQPSDLIELGLLGLVLLGRLARMLALVQ